MMGYFKCAWRGVMACMSRRKARPACCCLDSLCTCPSMQHMMTSSICSKLFALSLPFTLNAL